MFSPQASDGLQAHPYDASRGALGPAFYGRHPRTTTSACIGARCNIAARHIADGVTAEAFKSHDLKGSGEPSDPVNRPAVHYSLTFVLARLRYVPAFGAACSSRANFYHRWPASYHHQDILQRHQAASGSRDFSCRWPELPDLPVRPTIRVTRIGAVPNNRNSAIVYCDG